MEDFALDALLYKLLNAGASMGFNDPKALGIKGLQILAILAVMVLIKKVWGGYRKNFKLGSEPLFWASKDLKDKGGWAGLALLPVALMETVLLPATGVLGCFTRRTQKEKEEFVSKKRDTVRVLKQQERKAKKLDDRVGALEVHSVDVAEAIEELHLNSKKLFTTVKTTKSKLSKLTEENAELRKQLRGRTKVTAGKVEGPDAEEWQADLRELDV